MGIAPRDNLLNKKRNIPSPNRYKIENIFDTNLKKHKGVLMGYSRDVSFSYTLLFIGSKFK